MPFDDIDKIQITAGPDSDPLPEDVYDARITDMKLVEGKKFQSEELEKKILFEFTVTKGDFKNQKVYTRVRPKLSSEPKPSNLWKLASAALGQDPDKSKFHIHDLAEADLRISVTINERGYNQILGYMKAKA